MRKKIILAGTIGATMAMLVACGENNDNTLYNSLEKQVKHTTSNVDADQLNANLTLQATISGKEKELVVKVLYNANIMNKPSREASIVGSVKANESVLVIGEDSISGWYKVAYNGRVCYVEGTKLDVDRVVADNSGNSDNGVNSGDNNRPTSTVNPQRPIGTTGNNSNNDNDNDSGGNSGDEPSGDESTTPSGGGSTGDSGSDGEENTTSGNDSTEDNGTEEDSSSEGNGSEGDNGSSEDNGTEGDSGSSEEDTTTGNDQEDTTPPETKPEEDTTPEDTTKEDPSEEETTPPSEPINNPESPHED